MIRPILFSAATLATATCAPLPARAQALTLGNLTAALGRTCPTVAPVRTTAAFWRELAACQRTLTHAPVPAPAPGPAPAPAPRPAPTVPQAPMPDVPTPFALAKGLKPSWGTGEIPGIYHPDEGAFRFNCKGDGPLANDDPVLYPGQPGAAHLHLVWGSRLFDASLTPERLLAASATNCNRTPFSLNRSSYWMPALVHDSGKVARPNVISVYYKRPRKVSKACDPNNPIAIGICVGLPNRIRFIFGWDSTRPTAAFKGASWGCTGVGPFADLDRVFQAGCKAGDELVANTVAPHCWDGRNLDHPGDHRSHMAYGSYGDSGVYRCPATHRYLIPQQENKAIWTVTADMIGVRADGTRYSRVKLSSDHMLPGAKPGQTLHADYMEAWLTEAKTLWEDNCIEKGLSCSGGDLGNGQQLIGAE